MLTTVNNSPDYDRPDHWSDKANCKGKAFELFEYQESDSPLAKDMNFKQRVEFNKANFDLAEEICIECPVFFQCKEDAAEEDKFWTVRGGEPPARFAGDPERYAKNGRKPFAPGDRTCGNGHFVPGGGKCKTCHSERQRLYRDKARGLRH